MSDLKPQIIFLQTKFGCFHHPMEWSGRCSAQMDWGIYSGQTLPVLARVMRHHVTPVMDFRNRNMLHYFLKLACIVLALTGYSLSQGNLQFNEVKYITWTGTATTPCCNFRPFGPVTNITVPIGKVCKIESMNISRSYAAAGMGSNLQPFNGYGNTNTGASIFLGNTIV